MTAGEDDSRQYLCAVVTQGYSSRGQVARPDAGVELEAVLSLSVRAQKQLASVAGGACDSARARARRAAAAAA
jgi:hypothetical protein